jgi:hypothetical protein
MARLRLDISEDTYLALIGLAVQERRPVDWEAEHLLEEAILAKVPPACGAVEDPRGTRPPPAPRLEGRTDPEPTGSPEAVTRLQLPQIVACGFPALRSSEDASQHCVLLQPRIGQAELRTLERIGALDA